MKRFLFWAPRILAVFFAAFLTIFAVDAFATEQGSSALVGDLALHLAPALAVAFALVLAWRWEGLGATLFLGMAIFYVASSWGRFPLLTYVQIAGPLLLVSGLFLLNWKYRTQLRRR